MKKFSPQTGGHPFRLDDLIHVQNAFTETNTGIGAAFNNGNALVLQGCVVTIVGFFVSANVSAGYIYYNGEIFKVNAITGIALTNPLYWKIVQTTEQPVTLTSPYTVQYQDSLSKDVHLRRTMVPFCDNGSSPDALIADSVLPRLPAILPKFTSLDSTNTTQNTNITNNTNSITSINNVLNNAWVDIGATSIFIKPFAANIQAVAGYYNSAATTTVSPTSIAPPVGTSCFFRQKVVGKTVHIAWLLEINWNSNIIEHIDNFRITLPISAANSAFASYLATHDSAYSFPAGIFVVKIVGSEMFLYCHRITNGVQYSGAGFNFDYNSSNWITNSGFKYLFEGQMVYESA